MRSLPGKYTVLLLFCLLLPLSVLSCRERAWGVACEEILTRLEKGDRAFLSDVSETDAAQSLKLGMDAPWYMAQHAQDAGNYVLYTAFLDIGARYSPAPFNLLCLRELALAGSPEQRREAIDRLQEPSEVFPSFEHDAVLLNALFLADEGQYDKIPGGLIRFFAREEYTDEIIKTGLRVPVSVYPQFDAIFSFRRLSEQRAYRAAWEEGKKLFADSAPELFYRSMLSDFGRCALYGASDADEALAVFTELSERTNGGLDVPEEYAGESVPYMLSFYRGRLLSRRGASFYNEARSAFLEAFDNASDPFDRDVAIWYLLDLSSENHDRLMEDLIGFAPEWGDPSFFSGMVDRLIVYLIQKRDFESIGRLYSDIHEHLDRETHARISYIAAKSGSLSGNDATQAYNTAYSEDHASLYYRMLASVALGSIPETPSLIYNASAETESAGSDREKALAPVLRGFIVYSLPDRLFPFARDYFPDIAPDTAMALADRLAENGFHTAALRLMVLSVQSEQGPVTDSQLASLYPRPWLEEVSTAAARFGIPEYLLYALIRTESFFNASVVSHAGAVGLTQLMPATAGDVARKLRISDYELTDPATNLVFGASYLAELVRRLDGNVMAALFSYNAGITRVRAWMRAGSDLDPLLLLESIPFAETRGYGRKVLAASIIYGYLYYQKSPDDVIRELF